MLSVASKSGEQEVAKQVSNNDVGMEADEEEEDDAFFQDIELLQNHGINVADLKKLKSVGVCTIKGAQMMTKRRLCAIKGLSEAKVDKIKEAVAKMFAGAAFCTALQVFLTS